MSGAMIIRRQNRYIEAFELAGATAPASAQTLEQLGQRRSPVFFLMISYGVFVDAGDDKYYLNPANAERFRAARRRRLIIIVIAALSVMALVMLLR